MRLTFVVATLAVAISGCGADPKESFESHVQMMEKSLAEASKDSPNITISPVTYDVTNTDSEVAPYRGTMAVKIISNRPDIEGTGGISTIYGFNFREGAWQPGSVKPELIGYGDQVSDATAISKAADQLFLENSGIRLHTLNNITN